LDGVEAHYSGAAVRHVLALAAAVLLAVPASACARETTGRVLVTLRPGATPETVARAAGARVTGPTVPAIGVAALAPGGGRTVAATLRALQGDPRVLAASPERRMATRDLPNDPALVTPDTDRWVPPGTTLQWTLQREGFPAAWDLTTGAGALVAVIDSGVDGSHPEFAGKIAGAIDEDASSGAAPTTDQNGHGTHVASLACASTGNAAGIAGAGRDCRLLVVRTDFTEASVIAGLVIAAQRGAQAVNLSFGGAGGTPDPALAAALRYAVDHGTVPVAAAADDPVEDQGHPADLIQPPGTGPSLDQGIGLVVTAATAAGTRATFAGRGSEISLAAYGVLTEGTHGRGIIGAYPAGVTARETGSGQRRPCRCRATIAGDSRYAFLSGTSMAAPQVSAAAALVRAVNPSLSVAEVVGVLKSTAQRPAGTGWTPDLGWGILDSGAAVDAARRIDHIAPSSRARAAKRVRGHARRVRVRVRLRGRDRAPAPLIASGIRRFEVWAARPHRRAHRLRRTTHHRTTVRLAPGRYRVWSIAVDRAGNREARPRRADVRLRVARR
jgi:subtilisin family serine protease